MWSAVIAFHGCSEGPAGTIFLFIRLFFNSPSPRLFVLKAILVIMDFIKWDYSKYFSYSGHFVITQKSIPLIFLAFFPISLS